MTKDTYFTVSFKNSPGVTLFLSPAMLERLLEGLDEKAAEALIVTERELGKGVMASYSN